jgi:hypothetical protein
MKNEKRTKKKSSSKSISISEKKETENRERKREMYVCDALKNKKREKRNLKERFWLLAFFLINVFLCLSFF